MLNETASKENICYVFIILIIGDIGTGERPPVPLATVLAEPRLARERNAARRFRRETDISVFISCNKLVIPEAVIIC